MSNGEQDREKSPRFDFNKGIMLNGPGVKLKMLTTQPLVSGKSSYGEWFLWKAEVENVTVFEGKKPSETQIDNYTGEAVFFSNERVNGELLKAINNEEDVVLLIKKNAEETQKGMIKKYIIERVGGSNKPSTDGMTPGEIKLVADATGLVKSGYELTEDDFVKASKDDIYGNIPEDRVRQLYGLVGK